MRLFLADVLLEKMALDPSRDGSDILPMALLVPAAVGRGGTGRLSSAHRCPVFRDVAQTDNSEHVTFYML
jgi:hypothetical protein